MLTLEAHVIWGQLYLKDSKEAADSGYGKKTLSLWLWDSLMRLKSEIISPGLSKTHSQIKQDICTAQNGYIFIYPDPSYLFTKSWESYVNTPLVLDIQISCFCSSDLENKMMQHKSESEAEVRMKKMDTVGN